MIEKPYGSYWGNAFAGEVGEVCNLIKKLERDNIELSTSKWNEGQIKTYGELLSEELAGSFIYLTLIARYYRIDLESSIINEISKVNKRNYMKDAK